MKILAYIKSHVVLSVSIAVVAAAGMIIAGRVANRGNAIVINQSNIKKVSLISVDNFRNDASKVSADGIVESVSQVDLKSQVSAPLALVNVSVGDTVFKGQTLAVLQNADIQAQLDQARSGLRLAQGQYAGSGISLESARKSAQEALRSSYLTADEIVNVDLAQFLFEPAGSNPSLSSLIMIDERDLRELIRTHYISSRDSFSDWKEAAVDSMTASTDISDILSAISLSQKELQDISLLLDLTSKALSSSVRNFSDTYTILLAWQEVVTAARASANASIKSLTAAEAALSGAQVTYDTPAQAQISSAQAIVRNLEAQLAKTVIVSPINGKIAALPLRQGELAQPGQLIATVVGGGGLQIKAYASAEDFSRIQEGAEVLIQGKFPGKVANVAPSINQDNKKVEIKVSVNSAQASNLVIGQNVTLSIDAAKISPSSAESTNYLLPIQNIKIIPGAAHVFTVNDASAIVRNPVIIGKIEGDFVEIIEGITPGMMIVSPVYELEEGEKVVVLD